MEDPRIISTQFNSPKMPYYNVLVNSLSHWKTLEVLGKRHRENCGKKKHLRGILSFWNKDYDRATYLKRVGGFLIPIKNIGS